MGSIGVNKNGSGNSKKLTQQYFLSLIRLDKSGSGFDYHLLGVNENREQFEKRKKAERQRNDSKKNSNKK